MKTQSNQICHLPQMIHSSTELIEMAHNERFCTTTKISKTLVVVVGHLTFEYICIEKKDKKPVADVADWIPYIVPAMVDSSHTILPTQSKQLTSPMGPQSSAARISL